MIAEIISVGTEILLGNILNTNAQYLSKKLAACGVEVHYQTVVGDNPARIMDAIKIAFSRSDMVIMTGGLGPTKDDLTKEMLAAYFHKELVYDEKALAQMSRRLKAVEKESLAQSLRKQALVPKDSIILYNHHGTAPGIIMEDDGHKCILLPGPPKEMEPMLEEYCLDYIHFLSSETIVSMNIKMLDFQHAPVEVVGEAYVADTLGDLLDGANPTVATYAKEDGCLIRISAKGASRQEALQLMEPYVAEIRRLLKDEYIASIQEDI